MQEGNDNRVKGAREPLAWASIASQEAPSPPPTPPPLPWIYQGKEANSWEGQEWAEMAGMAGAPYWLATGATHSGPEFRV